jgi:hypothetical protein
MAKYPEKHVNINGEKVRIHKINADINGNPRYVTHFLDIGVKPKDYGSVPGLTKYRAKWFEGGYVFQSHNVQDDMGYMIGKVKEFYGEEDQ